MKKYFVDLVLWIIDCGAREEEPINRVGIAAEYWDRIEDPFVFPFGGGSTLKVSLDKVVGTIRLQLFWLGEITFDDTLEARRMEVSV